MRYLLILIVVLLITACSGGGSGLPPPPPNIGKYAPEINPMPKYFMTVQGLVDPKLISNHTLEFIADYSTGNPKCQYVISSIEGVSSDRKQSLILFPNFDKLGKYELKVPLDKYQNGVCDWSISSISYKFSNTDLNFPNAIAYFDEQSKNRKYQIHDKMQCINNHCVSIVPPYFDTTYFLSTKYNYTFKLDFIGN